MIRKLFALLFVLAFVSLFYTGCSEDNSTNPITGGSVAAPTNVKVMLDASVGGGSFSVISWNSSTDESNSDFKGYVIVTDSVNINGNRLGRFDSSFVDKSAADLYNVTGLVRGALFKTLVYAVNNNGDISDAATSIVYSGVYSGEGTIDEYSTSASTQSAFGWDPSTGLGTQYSYSSANADLIDINVRNTGGQLTFYSPGAVPDNPISPARVTTFALLGQGGDAYNTAVEAYSDLTEPTASSMAIADENVYLLKTQDSVYVKLWVTDISGTTFQTVQFTYKIQPVQGLKILKR